MVFNFPVTTFGVASMFLDCWRRKLFKTRGHCMNRISQWYFLKGKSFRYIFFFTHLTRRCMMCQCLRCPRNNFPTVLGQSKWLLFSGGTTFLKNNTFLILEYVIAFLTILKTFQFSPKSHYKSN